MNQESYRKISSDNSELVSAVCTLCERNFSSEIELNQHRSWCQCLCSVCKNSFENVQLYKQHRCNRVSCKECKKSFDSENELTAHIKVHSEPITCLIPSCRGETFTSKLMLRDHMFKKHTKRVKFRNGNNPWVCLLDGFSHVCSGTYPGRFKMLRHISSVAKYKPWNCPECQKSFGVEYNLNNHLRKIHSVVGDSWKCCGKDFKMKSLFRVHARNYCPTKGRLATINFRNLNTAEVESRKENLKMKRIKAEIRKERGSKEPSNLASNGAFMELMQLRIPQSSVSAQTVSEIIKPQIERQKKRKAEDADIENIVRQAPNMSTVDDLFDTPCRRKRGKPRSRIMRNNGMGEELREQSPQHSESASKFLWEELPDLASPGQKLFKNSVRFNSLGSNEMKFNSYNYSLTPSDEDISANVISEPKPKAFKKIIPANLSPAKDEFFKFPAPAYQQPNHKVLEPFLAQQPTLILSGRSSSNERKDELNLSRGGDGKGKNPDVNSKKFLLNNNLDRKGKQMLKKNPLRQKDSTDSLYFDPVLNDPPPIKPKMSMFDIILQLEVAEKKLQAIRSLVSNWKVKGTKEDYEKLIKEIKRNL